MEALFTEVLETLRGAKQTVDEELRVHTSTQAADRTPLLSLREAARTFGDQADGLFQMMFERGAAQDALDEAESLCDFFRDTEDQIEAVLAMSHS